MTFPDFGTLPIDSFLQAIGDSLLADGRVVLAAETGAGKTTRVPSYLLERIEGKILVLEPRRLAAMLTANYCAEVRGENIGETVGYHIRHQFRASKNTRLLFITEAMLLRYLQNDPMLNEYQAIVIDEFHERNIYTDLALALIHNLRVKRPELLLLVMSATMDSEAVSSYLQQAPIIKVPGRSFPLQIEYRETAKEEEVSAIAEIVKSLHSSSKYAGNILLFSIGAGEIIRLQNALTPMLDQNQWEILPLFSDMSKGAQQRVFSGGKRKLILATNVAETSITLPNISAVIDLGEAKIAAISPWSGMSTLETMRISKASADQRAGRAGRTAEGLVYRLYSRADYMLRSDFTAPDVERLDLSQTCLDLLSLDLSPPHFSWFSPPKQENLQKGMALLKMLDLVTAQGDALTALGQEVARLPLHPRFGALVIKAKEQGILSHGIYAAALLSEGDIVEEAASNHIDDRDPKKNLENSCDLLFRIKLLKDYRQKSRHHRELRFIFNDNRLAKVMSLVEQLHRLLKVDDQLLEENNGESDLWRPLLFSFADRVAKKQDLSKKQTQAQYHFCMGKGGVVNSSSVLYRSSPAFILALDSLERLKGNAAKGIQVRLASTISLDQLLGEESAFLRSEMTEELDSEKKKLRFFQVTYYGKITLSSKQLGNMEAAHAKSLDQMIKQSWPYPFADESAWKIYHAKVDLLERHSIEHQLPRFDGELFDLFLMAITDGVSDLKELAKKCLRDLIWQQLGELERYQLLHLTPDFITLKNGSKLAIEYHPELGPIIEAPLQQFYGEVTHPTIGEEKIPITLRFLSPAKRLLQTSSDLPAFWKGSYLAIAKELRARYPKHYWPENPESAKTVFLKYQLSKS